MIIQFSDLPSGKLNVVNLTEKFRPRPGFEHGSPALCVAAFPAVPPRRIPRRTQNFSYLIPTDLQAGTNTMEENTYVGITLISGFYVNDT